MSKSTRRTFLKHTGMAGLGLSAAWSSRMPSIQAASAAREVQFLTERARDSMLFPRPSPGQTLLCTPPGLAWLPAEGTTAYRVQIRQAQGGLLYEKDIGTDPVHLPDQILPSGQYEWDVAALDAAGMELARRGWRGFAIAENAAPLPWVEPKVLLARVPRDHPRLLYPKRDLEALRQTLATTRRKAWENCRRRAERALDRPAPVYPSYHLTKDPVKQRLEYGRYFADFRRYIDGALMDLALAFVMTEETQYATAAKRILLEVAQWSTADDDVTSVNARWGDEPGLSFSKCAHFAYDWLYPAFTAAERALVFKMCEARAWQTHRRLVRSNYLTYPGDSHNGRLIAYLADMAVAMAGESDGAVTWLDYSLKALTTLYPHWGGAGGGWAEGVPYGLWYNTFYIPAFESLRQLAGFDLWQRDFFRQVRYFFFYSTALRGEIRPFGDSAEGSGPGASGGGGYADLMWFHAHRFQDAHVGWWVNQIKDWAGPSGVGALLFPREVPSQPPSDLPASRLFQQVGWAALHSDLSRPDQDTFLLFKSSPYGSVSHSHADQNAFALMKGGKALAIPSGYYGPSYGMPHHAEWTRSTKANNCVLIDGHGQTLRSAQACGRILAFQEGKEMTYVAGDASQAYGERLTQFERHILFLRPGLVLMLDDLAAPHDARYQWMLHAFEKLELGQGLMVSRREGATLEVRLRSPAGLALSQTDLFDTPYNQGVPQSFQRDMPNHWHVTAATQRPDKSVRIAACLSVYGPDEPFKTTLLETEGWWGARAEGEFGAVEGWIQLKPGSRGPAGFGQAVQSGQARLAGRIADGQTFGF